MLKRWETTFSIDYGILSLLGTVVQVLVFAHWSACLWSLQASFTTVETDSWLFNNGYCEAVAGIQAEELDLFAYPSPHGSMQTYRCRSPTVLYASSLCTGREAQTHRSC